MKENLQNYTQNRELSWLRFNQRVLSEATDETVPLLERLKFISIFTSNLDEFFMIRVGTLHDLSQIKSNHKDNKTGMNPSEQLEAIFRAVKPLINFRDEIYENVTEQLKTYGVHGLRMNEIEKKELKYLKNYFLTQINPILSPQIIDPHHPFPFLVNKNIYVGATLANDNEKKDAELFGIIPIPTALPEVIFLPGADIRYVFTSDVVSYFADTIFNSYKILESTVFSVTRNADISSGDEAFDVDEDFRDAMQQLLNSRKRLAPVRLELKNKISGNFLRFLCEKLELTKVQVFITSSPLTMSYAFGLEYKISGSVKSELVYPPFEPQPSNDIRLNESIIKQLQKKDLLLFYPYESMDPFLKLLKEAAYDNSVISIKISIYRLAKNAKIVDYLCAAAENDKDVTVLIELRARFDEQNNIDWSQRLEQAGCRIIYGFEGYKVHSKVCLITRRERGKISYITQIGTGNYNEKTSKQYTDFSLMTSDMEIGTDANEFFKNMAIGNLEGNYSTLLVAPNSMKSEIIKLIDREIAKGTKGRIFLKFNSISDLTLINKLAEASLAGVNIQMIVRGICCILPQVEGKTDNIFIKSIVGRYLEHSRIYLFGSGNDEIMYISSADFMTRNMDKRVEVGCPIKDKTVKEKIMHFIEVQQADNTKARIMRSDGTYRSIITSNEPIDNHTVLMNEARRNAGNANSESKSFNPKDFIAEIKRKFG